MPATLAAGTPPAERPITVALLDVRTVADLLNCSTRHIRRLADSGRMPPPIRLGSLLRWRRADLDAWIAAGCKTCR